MRKIVATTLAGALLAAVPALAQAASATDGYLHIGGSNRLAAVSDLRIPIRCAVDCETTTLTKLTTPGDEIGPDKVIGHLDAGKVKKLMISLNGNATQDIKDHPNSRLRITVKATSSDGGTRAKAVKVFRFK